ncbi:ly6/PLAUR domain-containing protein 3 isoform X2 [Chroicocephalus ridibundus]|uniref:ly6/PLAUR domain-containing protein 3 isoform X2 n=1 Tax=Chroicocephalus ridibundus TaxID=1192867 RepID=UPI002FDD5661
MGPCRALLGLESGNGTRGRHVTVRCCRGGSCPREPDPPPSGLRCWGCDGPEPHGCDPQVLLCRGGLTHCVLARTYGGAVGLECLSCGAEDGTCRQAQNVTCPPESDVCAEALAALTWSHGRLALGARGCGRGRGGANARALPLSGLVLFARRRQCRGGRGCNGLLPLGTDGALPLPDDISEQPANGLRCFGCPEAGPCSPLRVLGCYGDQRGCFHGNLSLALGGVRLWREVRGCSRDAECGPTRVGDDAVGLTGSCCAGDLCNGPLPPPPPTNQSFFAPDRPRLQLLPQAPAPTPAPNPTKMAAAAAAPPPTNLPGGRQAAPQTAGAVTAMAATTTEMAAAGTKMAATRAEVAAAGTRGVNGGEGGVNGGEGDGGVHLANGNMADPNMAAIDPNMAAIDPNMAAVDPNMAAVDPKMAAADPKMAAGAQAPSGRAGGGRPLGGAGEGGPKGRGHPIGCPGWLLPLLLWPLL